MSISPRCRDRAKLLRFIYLTITEVEVNKQIGLEGFINAKIDCLKVVRRKLHHVDI